MRVWKKDFLKKSSSTFVKISNEALIQEIEPVVTE